MSISFECISYCLASYLTSYLLLTYFLMMCTVRTFRYSMVSVDRPR